MSTLGRYLSIEAAEGGGKSTQIQYIHAQLENAGHRVMLGREPGGTPFGEAIRTALFTEHAPMADRMQFERSTRADTLALFAARDDHLDMIWHYVEAGWIYLSDRCVDSTWAYNVGVGNTNAGFVHYLESVVCGGRMPHATLLLDLPVEVSVERCRARSLVAEDAMERRYQDLAATIRKNYLKRATDDPERFTVIDATGSIADVSLKARQWLVDLKLIPS